MMLHKQPKEQRIVALVTLMAFMSLLLVLSAGCATNVTTQRDISYEIGENGKAQPVRETATVTKVRTFWDSRSALANFKATQSDKTQSTSIGSSAAEASSTNITAQLEALAKILSALRPAP